MGVQKKHGKGRLDKWYKLAKEKGYRARAAFKLIQLNKKYGFLEKSKVLLDLCAAPGSWCQVAVETMPVNSIIVGVDLSPIKPIPKVITFQSDITTEKCRATIRQHLKTWKADTVLHDGAPNVGTAWVQDSFNQAELALQAMKLATEFLVEGGTFVTKVFRSKDYNSLLWVFNQLFAKVEATKPPSSRNVSAEIFVVCRGFRAPKRIDPRFLDAKAVFADLADPTPNNEAKVFNPETKKRKRDGYEEGDYTQYKELPASAFIQTTDPIAILGQYNRLTFDQPLNGNGDVALAALGKLPETTEDVRLCCADLRVLSRKEFKLLLRWRLQVRETLGFPTKKSAAEAAAKAKTLSEEVAEIDTMDEEMKIQKELEALRDRANSKKKREKRRQNEQKQKEIVRMQMNMTAPMDIGMEQSETMGDDGSMFALKKLDRDMSALQRIARGKMALLNTNAGDKAQRPTKVKPQQQKTDRDSGIGSSGDTDDESEDEDGDEDGEGSGADDDDADADDEEDRLERELDGLYDQYQERKAAADAKYRAKKARRQNEDGEWEGFSGDENGDDAADDSDGELEEDDSSSSSDDDDDGDGRSKLRRKANGPAKPLLTDLSNEPSEEGGLSKRARSFFSQDIFKDIPGILDEPAEQANTSVKKEKGRSRCREDDRNGKSVAESDAPSDDDGIPTIAQQKKNKASAKSLSEDQDSTSKGGFEIVKHGKDGVEEEDWEETDKKRNANEKVDIDIITAEAMTLAHSLATGKRSKEDIVDEGFNKHAFRDKDGLPEWFMDDESKHDRVQRPITKAAAEAIKEKLRALNARPIKKVREARARKKFKAAQRLEKLKKKSELLIADEGMTEKEKADTIGKMLQKASKKKPHIPTKVVVARGANRGIQGRPRGVKGRYKLVDARMKKETRALRRIAKKHKK